MLKHLSIYTFVHVCSGFDNSIHVDLYDGDDNLVTKMVEAGFATRIHPSPGTVRFHESVDSEPVGEPSFADEPEIIFIPG